MGNLTEQYMRGMANVQAMFRLFPHVLHLNNLVILTYTCRHSGSSLRVHQSAQTSLNTDRVEMEMKEAKAAGSSLNSTL